MKKLFVLFALVLSFNLSLSAQSFKSESVEVTIDDRYVTFTNNVSGETSLYYAFRIQTLKNKSVVYYIAKKEDEVRSHKLVLTNNGDSTYTMTKKLGYKDMTRTSTEYTLTLNN
jgi:hypothetical protein